MGMCIAIAVAALAALVLYSSFATSYVLGPLAKNATVSDSLFAALVFPAVLAVDVVHNTRLGQFALGAYIEAVIPKRLWPKYLRPYIIGFYPIRSYKLRMLVNSCCGGGGGARPAR